MHRPNPFRKLATVALVLTLAATSWACGGGGGGGSSPGGGGSGASNGAPFLGCVKGVFTAGGSRILVRWGEATDDSDAPSAIRYNVYVASTSGGQDFNAPTATSAAGATSMQLTDANSPAIAVGQEVFVVVRAVDSAGAENENFAECACTCVPTASVAYVDPAAAGPGTLGDPADPFTTLQAGIDAVPAAGGAVLVADATINTTSAATDAGAAGSTLAIYGSFPSAAFTAGATAADLLAAQDPAGSPTVIDGVGVNPTLVLDQIGHLDVRNGLRRTYVGGIRFQDDESEILLGGRDVNIVVCCCTFTDTDVATGTQPSDGCWFDESAPTADQHAAIVGCLFDEVSDGVQFTGGIHTLTLAGNRAEDCSQWVRATPAMIPAGADYRLHIDCNDVLRINSAAFDIFTTPEVAQGAGSVGIRVHGNRISSGSNNNIEDFGEHGTGSTMEILVEDNFIGPVDSDGLIIDFLPNNNSDIEFVAAATVNLTYRNNIGTMFNSEGLEIDDMVPAAGATWTMLFEDSTFLQSDQEFFEYDRSFPGAALFSQDGAMVDVIFRRCHASTGDGFVDATQGIYRAGRSSFLLEDCTLENMTDEPIDIDLNNFTTPVTSQADDTNETRVIVRRNVFTGTDESSLEVLDLDQEVSGPAVCHFLHNSTYSGEESNYIRFRCDSAVADATLEYIVEGNDMNQADDDNILDVSVEGSNPATIYTRICNNRMRAGRDIVEYRGNQANKEGYVVFAHNDLSGCTEGESVEFNLSGTDSYWSVLIARNQVVGGGDDSEEAFELRPSTNIGGADFLVRNNIAYGSGGGIEAESTFDALQMINNTVAFSGQGFNGVLGSDDGPNSPCYVHNCVSFGNDFEDVSNETIASYTMLQDDPASAGFGSILGDPVFVRQGSYLDPNTWFQLAAGSPARDAGDPAAEFNDPDGTRNDMGAFGGPGAGPLGLLANPTDASPLYFVGFSPMVDLYAGATFIGGPAAPVDMVFSHPIDGTTAGAGTLAFTAGGAPITGVYATDGRRVTFTPDAPWPAGEHVTVTMSTGLLTADGAPLAFTHVRHFGTRSAPVGETEANDTAGTANAVPVAPATVMAGDLSADTDQDFYAVMLTAGERFQASCVEQRLGASAANMDLQLIAPDGTTVLFENTGSVSGDDAFIDWTVTTSGTYYVRVFDQFSAAGIGPFPYELQMFRR